MSTTDNLVEVTLARDLAVGPKGGVRKADTNVRVPVDQAALLIMLGDAREPGPQAPANMVPETPAVGADATSTGTE